MTTFAPTLPSVSIDQIREVYESYRGTFPKLGLTPFDNLDTLAQVGLVFQLDDMEEAMMAIEPEECFT